MIDTTRPNPTAMRPPWFVRAVMGRMTRVFNPLIGRLAGRKHLKMVAQIQRAHAWTTAPSGSRSPSAPARTGAEWAPTSSLCSLHRTRSSSRASSAGC
jgi:hypothetical protein